MRKGTIVKEFDKETVTQAMVLAAAQGPEEKQGGSIMKRKSNGENSVSR